MEVQDSDCPPQYGGGTTTRAKNSVTNREKLSVESPPHTVAGVERSVYRKDWEQTIQSEL